MIRARQHPWVIAHRGASGYRPEHTAAAYRLAAEQGADVLEPDLLLSADGQLVVRHDLGLARSTDIAGRPEFAARARTDAHGVRDWWIDDFTWNQLRTLRAIQPWPMRVQDFNGQPALLLFRDLVELTREESRRRGRTLWLYPETKHPAYFLSRGQDIAAILARELHALELVGAHAPVLVQSFDWRVLPLLKQACGIATVALLDAQSKPDLAHLAGLADGLGVAKSLLFEARPLKARPLKARPIKARPMKAAGEASALVTAAHAQGLFVHAWTFRSDQLPSQYQSAAEEYLRVYALGVDAVFSDFPDHAVAAREAHLQQA